VLVQPAMCAGDVLLVSSACMHGLPPAPPGPQPPPPADQLACEFISATAPASLGGPGVRGAALSSHTPSSWGESLCPAPADR
jgi:hypothetical protein